MNQGVYKLLTRCRTRIRSSRDYESRLILVVAGAQEGLHDACPAFPRCDGEWRQYITGTAASSQYFWCYTPAKIDSVIISKDPRLTAGCIIQP